MIQETYLVGASLLAVIVDRLVIEKQLGKTPFPVSRSKLLSVAAYPVAAWLLLSLAAAGTWMVSAFLLRPMGALHAYPLLLVTMILFIALCGEIVLSQWKPFVFLNRLFTRAATACSIVGLMTLAPGADHLFRDDGLSPQGMAGGAAAGAVFCFLAMVWSGIEEKIDFFKTKKPALSLASMLCAAGLIAVALSGIPGFPEFFGGLFGR